MKHLILLLALWCIVPTVHAQKERANRLQVVVNEPEIYRLGTDSIIFHTRVDIPRRLVRNRTTYTLIYEMTHPDYPGRWQHTKLSFMGDGASRREKRLNGEKNNRQSRWQFKHSKKTDTLPLIYTGNATLFNWMEQEGMKMTVYRTYHSRPRRKPVELTPIVFYPTLRYGTPKPASPEARRDDNGPKWMEEATE